MRALFKTTAIIGASQVLVMMLQLIRGKAVAIFIGSEGVGVLGNTMAFTGFWQNALLLGFHFALLRFASEEIKENRVEVVRSLFSTTILVHLMTSFIGISVALILLKQISISLYQSQTFAFPLALVLLGLPFAMLRADIGNLFNAFNRVKVLGSINVLSALVGLVIIIPLIAWLSLRGAILSIPAQSAVMLLIVFYLYHRYLRPKLDMPRLAFSKPHALRMLKFGGANQVCILINSFSAYFLRALVTAQLLLAGAGIFNAGMRLGAYVLLVQSALGIYYYPKISTIYKDRQATIAEVNNVLRFYLLLLTPVLVGIIVLADLLIRLLLTREFLPVLGILGWILAARFFEVIQSILSTPFFIMEKYKIYLSITIAFNAVLVASTYGLLIRFGLLGAAIAQGVAYALLFVLSYIGAYKVFGFRMRSVNWILLSSALGLLAMASYMSHLGWGVRGVSVGAVLVWLGLAVRKREWREVMRYLRTCLSKIAVILRRE